MRIQFKEKFHLTGEEIFQYFTTPKAWTLLYGLPGNVKEYGNGWYAIPLKNFPFPLVARNLICIPNEYVKWEFKGFWKGEGEIRFFDNQDGVTVEGYEKISVRWLFCLSPFFEKRFLERQFIHIWELGWQRLRKKSQRHSDA
ncbi:MAG: hypothetical protein AB1757_14700 [Acidobacteriota bacterium]